MLKLIFRDFSDFSRYSQHLSQYLFEKGERDEETGFYVKLAITELAGNVLRHSGCQANVIVSFTGGDITINIDGGSCFDYNTQGVMPPCSCESGRGIVLVKSIARSLVYKDGGKTAVCVIGRS